MPDPLDGGAARST